MNTLEKIVKTSARACKTVKMLNAVKVCVAVAACAMCAFYTMEYAKNR